MRATVVSLSLLLVTLGCGSGGSGAGDGGGGAGGGGAGTGQLTWLYNDVRQTASFASATRVTSSALDLLQVVGSNSAGAAVAFGVGVPPPLVPGSYTCEQPVGSTTIVTLVANVADAATGCVVEISAIGDATGERAAGNFRANVMAGSGAATVAEGVFDVPLVVTPLSTKQRLSRIASLAQLVGGGGRDGPGPLASASAHELSVLRTTNIRAFK